MEIKRKTGLLVLSLLLFRCVFSQSLTEQEAVRLARLPLHCITTEFPNKTSHTAEGAADAVLLPSQLHPAFYGCLDWHSSVHGHWLLVRVLKLFPGISLRDSILQLLNNSFQPEKIKEEVAYFSKYTTASGYERTYGWAWLLKLDQEMFTATDPEVRRWHGILQPLTQKIVSLWKAYLPKATYPNRTGVHPNSAFGLVFALDWARTLKDTAFERAITEKARYYYLDNRNTPAYLEPDGTDFLSPSLEIADLMRRVLPLPQFMDWLNAFYTESGIQRITGLPVVSDRTDMYIVHLDGLAISRAWCMRGVASVLPAAHPLKKVFENTAALFMQEALRHVASGNYGGEHWLASFALYALSLDEKAGK